MDIYIFDSDLLLHALRCSVSSSPRAGKLRVKLGELQHPVAQHLSLTRSRLLEVLGVAHAPDAPHHRRAEAHAHRQEAPDRRRRHVLVVGDVAPHHGAEQADHVGLPRLRDLLRRERQLVAARHDLLDDAADADACVEQGGPQPLEHGEHLVLVPGRPHDGDAEAVRVRGRHGVAAQDALHGGRGALAGAEPHAHAETAHVEGRHGERVVQLAARLGALLRLLPRVAGEDAEEHGHAVLQGGLLQTVARGLAGSVEVRVALLNKDAQGEDGQHVRPGEDPVDGEGQVEGRRHPLRDDVHVGQARGGEDGADAGHHLVDELELLLGRRHQRDRHVLRVRRRRRLQRARDVLHQLADQRLAQARGRDLLRLHVDLQRHSRRRSARLPPQHREVQRGGRPLLVQRRPARRTRLRLLHREARQHAPQHRHARRRLRGEHGVRRALADVLEVLRVTLDQHAEAQHAVHLLRLRQQGRARRQLVRPRHDPGHDARPRHAGRLHLRHHTLLHLLHHRLVPRRPHDADPQRRSLRGGRRRQAGDELVGGAGRRGRGGRRKPRVPEGADAGGVGALRRRVLRGQRLRQGHLVQERERQRLRRGGGPLRELLVRRAELHARQHGHRVRELHAHHAQRLRERAVLEVRALALHDGAAGQHGVDARRGRERGAVGHVEDRRHTHDADRLAAHPVRRQRVHDTLHHRVDGRARRRRRHNGDAQAGGRVLVRQVHADGELVRLRLVCGARRGQQAARHQRRRARRLLPRGRRELRHGAAGGGGGGVALGGHLDGREGKGVGQLGAGAAAVDGLLAVLAGEHAEEHRDALAGLHGVDAVGHRGGQARERVGHVVAAHGDAQAQHRVHLARRRQARRGEGQVLRACDHDGGHVLLGDAGLQHELDRLRPQRRQRRAEPRRAHDGDAEAGDDGDVAAVGEAERGADVLRLRGESALAEAGLVVALVGQVAVVVRVVRAQKRLHHDVHVVLLEGADGACLQRAVRQQLDGLVADADEADDVDAGVEGAEVVVVAQLPVGAVRVEALVRLQLVRVHLVHEADAAALVAGHVDDHAGPAVGDEGEGRVELLAAVAPHAAEQVARRALRVDAQRHALDRRRAHVAERHHDVLVAAVLDEAAHLPLAQEAPGALHGDDALGGEGNLRPRGQNAQRVAVQVVDERVDGDARVAHLPPEALAVVQALHLAVEVHELADGSHGEATGQPAQVHGRLRVAPALGHAAAARTQGEDVPGTAEVAGLRGRVGEGAEREHAVVRGDARRQARAAVGGAEVGDEPRALGHNRLEVGGDGEGGALRVGVVQQHGEQAEVVRTVLRHGRAQNTGRVVDHDGRDLLRHVLRGHDDVALVLAVLVVHHNYGAALPEGLDRNLDRRHRAVHNVLVVDLGHGRSRRGNAGGLHSEGLDGVSHCCSSNSNRLKKLAGVRRQ
eukprot:Rhum_TRINITY_DN10987_c0_g1::Rhum_TRINITY_DN10987_c0_g1_i1::g.41227::m.41227